MSHNDTMSIKYSMDFSTQLKLLRNIHKLSQTKLAEQLGVSQSTIAMLENGERKPSIVMLAKIADFFDIDLDTLAGRNLENYDISNILPVPRTVKKPRLGAIACGEPILAEENLEGYDDVPEDIKCDFTLLCKGDSMINARINNNDIVYIRQQDIVDNGEIAAVLINNEATLKRVYIYDDKVVLQPENTKYAPLVYSKEEMNNVKIIGKAVGFTSRIQ